MAETEKDFSEVVEMSNAQFDSFLEQLAKLVEQAETVEQAAEIVRQAKTNI